MIRPFLKWAGNKYRTINAIIKNLPEGKRLIEPFTGSGAVFLNTNFPNYLLAEANKDLIDVFTSLQKYGDKFINQCENYFTNKHNTAEIYYELRQKFNQMPMSKRTRAAIFLYLNRHSYNGLCRYNSCGKFNVPFGRFIKPYFPRQEMLLFYKKSQVANFIFKDFQDTFKYAQNGDIIYCDPPYMPLSNSSSFTTYNGKRFNESDQIILTNLAEKTAAKGIPVIISNHDTPFTRYHYRHAKLYFYSVKRFISCNSSKRLAVQELIAIFN